MAIERLVSRSVFFFMFIQVMNQARWNIELSDVSK